MGSSPNRVLGTIFGVFFVAIGIWGFFLPDGGAILGIFGVNLLHNCAHLLIGLILAVAAIFGGVASARTVNTIVGAAYLVLGVAGLFLLGTPVNFLAINAPDNVLHFASSVVLLAVGLGAERPKAKKPATR